MRFVDALWEPLAPLTMALDPQIPVPVPASSFSALSSFVGSSFHSSFILLLLSDWTAFVSGQPSGCLDAVAVKMRSASFSSVHKQSGCCGGCQHWLAAQVAEEQNDKIFTIFCWRTMRTLGRQRFLMDQLADHTLPHTGSKMGSPRRSPTTDVSACFLVESTFIFYKLGSNLWHKNILGSFVVMFLFCIPTVEFLFCGCFWWMFLFAFLHLVFVWWTFLMDENERGAFIWDASCTQVLFGKQFVIPLLLFANCKPDCQFPLF